MSAEPLSSLYLNNARKFRKRTVLDIRQPVLTIVVLFSVLFLWGFLGQGILHFPFLFLIGVVVPVAYLLDQSVHRKNSGWSDVGLMLLGAVAFHLGMATKVVIGWLL